MIIFWFNFIFGVVDIVIGFNKKKKVSTRNLRICQRCYCFVLNFCFEKKTRNLGLWLKTPFLSLLKICIENNQ